MSKKHFIALADMIKFHNQTVTDLKDCGMGKDHHAFTMDQIHALATFCQHQNPMFNESRWLGYVYDRCGKNGGKVKQAA